MKPDRRRNSVRPAQADPRSSETRLRVGARAAPSGPLPLHYTRMREVLVRHLSAIMVDSALDRAFKARGLTPRLVTASQLSEIVSEAMVGLRLFVQGERLPQLMLQLAEVLDAESK